MMSPQTITQLIHRFYSDSVVSSNRISAACFPYGVAAYGLPSSKCPDVITTSIGVPHEKLPCWVAWRRARGTVPRLRATIPVGIASGFRHRVGSRGRAFSHEFGSIIRSEMTGSGPVLPPLLGVILPVNLNTPADFTLRRRGSRGVA